MKIGLTLLALLLWTSVLSAENRIYKATSDQINYVGRTESLNDGSVCFDWVGVQLRTRFTGSTCSIRISDSKSSYFHVFIDGKFVKDINPKGKDKMLLIAADLEGGVHTLQLFKRTEASEGTTIIHEIILDGDAKLLPWLEFPTRKIEFIGNSITCGFGVETTNPHEEYTVETENAYYSYASLTARFFNADYTLIAHSGEGIVRNYGDKKRISDYTMRHRFSKQHDMDKNKSWNFSKWKPDVIVINLGTNDFSQDLQPTAEEFIVGYKELIQSVRKAYGNVPPILCLSSPMSINIQHKSIEKACSELNDDRIYFIPMFNYLLNNPTDMGMSYHPNRKGQKKLAMVLSAYMSSIMDWDSTKCALNINE